LRRGSGKRPAKHANGREEHEGKTKSNELLIQELPLFFRSFRGHLSSKNRAPELKPIVAGTFSLDQIVDALSSGISQFSSSSFVGWGSGRTA
jgi:hypothetical protein